MPCTQDVQGVPAYKPDNLVAMDRSLRLNVVGVKIYNSCHRTGFGLLEGVISEWLEC
jgi:hypothetical protein